MLPFVLREISIWAHHSHDLSVFIWIFIRVHHYIKAVSSDKKTTENKKRQKKGRWRRKTTGKQNVIAGCTDTVCFFSLCMLCSIQHSSVKPYLVHTLLAHSIARRTMQFVVVVVVVCVCIQCGKIYKIYIHWAGCFFLVISCIICPELFRCTFHISTVRFSIISRRFDDGVHFFFFTSWLFVCVYLCLWCTFCARC